MLLAWPSGCSSNAASASAAPGTFTEIYPLLFPVTAKPQCNFCHGLPANDRSNGSLSVGMDKATAYAALVGKVSSSSQCGGKTLVSPGNPEASLLYQKLTTTPPCGGHMPLGGDALPSDELEMVRSWIASGAKDD